MKLWYLLVSLLLAVSLAVLGCGRKTPEYTSGLKIKAFYTLDEYDASGRLVGSVTRPSESYVMAFMDMIYVQMSALTVAGEYDTGHTSRTLSRGQNSLLSSGPAGDITYGIVAGTGTNAVTISDYQLQTIILHGAASGKLLYGDEFFGAPSTVGSTRSFTTGRTLTNSSGASITVNEIGVYGCNAGTPYYFCMIRDVVAGGQAVANGHALTITYTISITV